MNPKKKKVAVSFEPLGGKHPREPSGFSSPNRKGHPREPTMSSAQGQRPSWHFRQIDFGGPFCPLQMDADMMRHVHTQLSQFETRLWREIEGKQSHAIEVWQLSDEARHRLRELELDDIEEVFSLRIGAKLRVFGIRDHTVLRILWWDPGHKVYITKGPNN